MLARQALWPLYSVLKTKIYFAALEFELRASCASALPLEAHFQAFLFLSSLSAITWMTVTPCSPFFH
jgi:hypothetical protein